MHAAAVIASFDNPGNAVTGLGYPAARSEPGKIVIPLSAKFESDLCANCSRAGISFSSNDLSGSGKYWLNVGPWSAISSFICNNSKFALAIAISVAMSRMIVSSLSSTLKSSPSIFARTCTTSCIPARNPSGLFIREFIFFSMQSAARTDSKYKNHCAASIFCPNVSCGLV